MTVREAFRLIMATASGVMAAGAVFELTRGHTVLGAFCVVVAIYYAWLAWRPKPDARTVPK
jgi:hypothetical protein